MPPIKRKRDQIENQIKSPDEKDRETFAEFQTGPLSLLLSSTQNQTPVLIQLRNDRKIIGTCRAFDHHMNLVMENVIEMWSETVKSGSGVSNKVNRTRNISKLFVRGDSIVLVVRDPAARDQERIRMEQEREREEREEGIGILDRNESMENQGTLGAQQVENVGSHQVEGMVDIDGTNGVAHSAHANEPTNSGPQNETITK